MTETTPETHEGAVDWRDLARIAFTALAAAAVWLRLWEPFSRVSVVGVVGTLVGGWPIFKEAWENIRERRMTMELSMTIALVAALAIGEFFTALVITGFVLAAEVLEGLTVGRGRRAIQDLLDFLPSTLTVRRPAGPLEVARGDVRPGDAVLVAPGGRIPVDGRVVSGHSFVDQAAITGEPVPVEVATGSLVYAGTVNQSGALEVLAERVGHDTSFGKIIEAVERAEKSRAPVQKTADRYAGYLVYFALGCAVLTFVLTHNIRATISVIIVAGACGIAAGTPLAVLGAIGRAARGGAIIKGGRYLEALWKVDVIAFDKTGTVTVGAPEVVGVRPVSGVTERTVIETAAVAERRSEHPLAKAIVRRANALGASPAEPETFSYQPGRGVVATQQSVEIVVGSGEFLGERGIADRSFLLSDVDQTASAVFVARSGRLLGAILIADAVRSEAPGAMRRLRAMGIRTVLLTGDTRAAADAVSRLLGADEVDANLLPDEKVERIRRLAAEGRVVAMVGDGINDAPALVQASVGVAMGSGTDVARESADIVLLGNDLSKLVDTVRVAKRARGIITFNFAGTMVVDAIGVGLAAAGLLNPLLAAFIHVASELTFILNSARLLPTTSSSHAPERGSARHQSAAARTASS
ncbi:MAG TPA: cation-translocating P-type ATPase [Vicinamibacterales bacterium]|nr:cation-translocating P-type ATPase [Vicinamibacterales bacterium]